MTPPPALHQRRCFVHPEREAIAGCRECRRPHCGECVTEHGGRLVCAACLARQRQAATRHRRRPPLLAWLRATAGVVTASAVAWLSFYVLGLLLLRVPDTFHAVREALTNPPSTELPVEDQP